jgi:hypothetical protein
VRWALFYGDKEPIRSIFDFTIVGSFPSLFHGDFQAQVQPKILGSDDAFGGVRSMGDVVCSIVPRRLPLTLLIRGRFS